MGLWESMPAAPQAGAACRGGIIGLRRSGGSGPNRARGGSRRSSGRSRCAGTAGASGASSEAPFDRLQGVGPQRLAALCDVLITLTAHLPPRPIQPDPQRDERDHSPTAGDLDRQCWRKDLRDLRPANRLGRGGKKRVMCHDRDSEASITLRAEVANLIASVRRPT